jgi:hypothetical protein
MNAETSPVDLADSQEDLESQSFPSPSPSTGSNSISNHSVTSAQSHDTDGIVNRLKSNLNHLHKATPKQVQFANPSDAINQPLPTTPPKIRTTKTMVNPADTTDAIQAFGDLQDLVPQSGTRGAHVPPSDPSGAAGDLLKAAGHGV